MAKKIKDYYGLACAKLITEKLAALTPNFASEEFLAELRRTLRGKSYSERLDAYATAFHHHLPGTYDEHLQLFASLLGPKLAESNGMFLYGWWLAPLGRYVEQHGADHWSISSQFIYELTQRYTGEFAIRPLLANEPHRTMRLMLRWSQDDSVHVRRLASEGLRPKLPWAKKSLVALRYPELYQNILSNLRHDGDRFVQKSVGNNLNDLMKEDPTFARAIITAWKKEGLSPATEWIIHHGLRNQKTTGTKTGN